MIDTTSTATATSDPAMTPSSLSPMEDHAPVVESGLPRLPSLTGLRWWAALIVVFHHSIEGFVGAGYVKVRHFQTMASGGYLGVTLFFVLSGFVLTWAWNDRESKLSFYVRRFARIYPLYVLSIALFVWFTVKFLHQPFSLKATVASLLLVQAFIPYREFYTRPSGVAWSLSCEAFFYLMMPMIMSRLWTARTRALLWTMVCATIWLVAVPTVVMATVHDGNFGRGFELNPIYRIGEFVIGICLAMLMRGGWRPNWNPHVVAVGLVVDYAVAAEALRLAFKHGWSLNASRYVASFIFLPAVVIAVAAFASADLQGKRTLVSNGTTVTLGEWSYAMYLSHVPILYLVSRIWVLPKFGPLNVSLPAQLAREVIIVLVCVAVAGILHKYLEMPANRAIRGWFVRRERARAATG